MRAWPFTALAIVTFAWPVWAQTNGGTFVPGQPIEVPTMEQFKALEGRVQANEAKNIQQDVRLTDIEARLEALESGTQPPGGGKPPTKPPVEPTPPPGELPPPPTGDDMVAYAENGESEEFDNLEPAINWLNDRGGGRVDVPAGLWADGEDGDGVDIQVRQDTIVNCAEGAIFEGWGSKDDPGEGPRIWQKAWLVARDSVNLTILRCECRKMYYRGGSYNAACIRNESNGTVWVKDSHFHNNENGILGMSSGERPDGILRIEDSVFECNGPYDSGRQHNIYTGTVGRFEVINSIIRGVKNQGHDLKILARDTLIQDSRVGGNNDDYPDMACDAAGGYPTTEWYGSTDKFGGFQNARLENSTFIHPTGAKRNVVVNRKGTDNTNCDRAELIVETRDITLRNSDTATAPTGLRVCDAPSQATMTGTKTEGVFREICGGNCTINP